MTDPSKSTLTDAPEVVGRLAADAAPRRWSRVRLPRMRVLHVLSSTNQLYSGIGRNLFELVSRMSDRADFEFAIDDQVEKNVDLLRDFCSRHGLTAHIGRAQASPRSLDVLNVDLPRLLKQGCWDAIECLCWANSSTNDCLLDQKGAAILGYTPHNQPIWSVPMSPEQAANTERVHRLMLHHSHVIFCDSPSERQQLEHESGRVGKSVHLPIGCDFELFRPGPLERRPQLLFVGDAAEPRKRIDRVLSVFAKLRRRHPELRLVFVGNKRERVRELIPPELRSACELRGYVSEAELRQAYAESLGLFLLSNCEAFGIPILEAMASGTPVFLSRLEETFSLFGAFRGAHFCPAEDLDETHRIVEFHLARGRECIREAIDDREALRAAFDWNAIAARKWEALAAAWYHDHRSRQAS